MILKWFRISAGLALVSLLPFAEIRLPAQAVTNAAGIWNNIMFSTPAWLAPQDNLNGAVIEVAGRALFESHTAQINVQSDGSFTGPVNGTLTWGGPGWVFATVPGDPPTAFAINAAADFGFSVKAASGPSHDLELLLKAPAAMTTNDFVGTWKMVSLKVPAELGLQKNLNGVVTEIIGREDFHASSGTLTVFANGTFAMDAGGGIATGTLELIGNGMLQAHVVQPPPDPPFTLTLFVNATKNVMATFDQGSDYRELDLLVKQPAGTTPGELKGLWHPGSFYTPSQLTLSKNTQGEVVAIAGCYDFEIYSLSARVGHNGDFTVAPDTVGRLTVAGPGIVTVTDTNTLGETESRTVWFNTTHDVFIGTGDDPSLELLVATRTPTLANPADSMGLILFPTVSGLAVCWASDTNRFLQSTTNLIDWATLTNTAGQSSMSIDPASASRTFYRLMEKR